MSGEEQDVTHRDLARKIDEAIKGAAKAEGTADEALTIAKANKTNLDEIAGATKLGKWLLPFIIAAGALGVALWQGMSGGK